MATAADVLLSTPSPAHLAWRASHGRWAFPIWLQHMNRVMVDFLLSPASRFLAVEVPVRHGKSLYTSVFTPAWYLGMFPEHQVLLTTYSDSLSRDFGRAARNVMEELGESQFGVTTRTDARASNDWKIRNHRGGMRAVSKGGTITGTGGNLIIIDDPVKDAEEAQSRIERDRLHEWYQRTLRTRLEPGGKIVLVMSRWHEDDLTARLVAGNGTGEGDKWERLHLPALAEPMPEEGEVDPETWRDPVGRRIGEALWPERWSRENLLQIKHAVGPFAWASNYQQTPVTPGGETFPRHKWGYVNELPRRCDLVARIDLADSGQDWAAVGLVGRDAQGLTYVVEVRRIRSNAHEVEQFIQQAAEQFVNRYGNVHFVLEQEPGSSGKTVADHYVKDVLAGYSVEAKPTRRNKEMNAQPLSAQLHADNVFLVRQMRPDGITFGAAAWWEPFVEEAREFPRGTNDDQIDVVSQAFNDLVERSRERKKSRATVSRPTGILPF